MKSICLFLVFFFLQINLQGQSIKVILDADTGNEMDDLYAIAYMVKKSGNEFIALTAAHFNNVDLVTYKKWNGYSTKNINTVKISYNLNKQIIAYMGRSDVKCFLGADKIIGRAWGGNEPRPSEASKAIIDEAMKIPAGEKLVVFTIGAVTNVVSAILEKPEIESKISLYMMGANYNAETGTWNKSEFNVRNDLNAFDYLLNSNVEMHIMPASTAGKFTFDRIATKMKLNSDSKIDVLLSERWEHVNAGENWIMWDLALLIAYYHPEMATESYVNTPPENNQRKVYIYTDLDPIKMEEEFWKVYLK
jgi:purine nucleosidase